MTYEQILKDIEDKSEVIDDNFWYVNPKHIKQSFIKYLQSQQEIVKNFAVGVSVDQRGRKWIDLEDLIKIYQAQIKELQ